MTPQQTHPTHAEPTPPFPEQEQEPPGREAEMQPLADHGEASYIGHGRLQDRVALITGADSGIGRAVALAFAREGADVVISYWNEHEDAKETVRLVEGAGRRALAIAGDLVEEDTCRRLVATTMEQFGQLDILVNNAAYQEVKDSIADVSTETFDRIFKTNVY